MATYPNKIEGASVYVDGAQLPAMAEVELPEVEFDTEEVSGMGMTGKVEGVLAGLSSAMEATLKPLGFSVQSLSAALTFGRAHEVEVRWFEDATNSVTRDSAGVPGRAFMIARPKGFNPGSVAAGEKAEPEITLAVQYLRVEINGSPLIECDPLNRIMKVNGQDLLAGLNAAL